MSRWLSPLMAFCLSFIIIVGLAPSLGLQIDRQIDFWALWLGTMLLLALPAIYLEIGLAKRSKTSALNALSSLTRDADASQRWRIVGWLSVVFIPFLAGGLIHNLSQLVANQVQLGLSTDVVFIAGAVLAFVLSFVPRMILVVFTALGVIASLVLSNTMGSHVTAWQMTPIEFNEWGNATILALVASGLGLGLYWQSYSVNNTKDEAATHQSLPIWIAQLIAVVAFGYFAISAALPAYCILFATVMASAILIQMAKEQLAQRNIALIIQFVILITALAVWAIPFIANVLTIALMLWGLVICLIYSIFVGWIMKISHLRKALNFSNEIFYNIWRIAVRIVLPLSIVLAIISYLGQLV